MEIAGGLDHLWKVREYREINVHKVWSVINKIWNIVFPGSVLNMIQTVSVKKTLETFEELGNCPCDYINGDGGKVSWVTLEIIALELLGKEDW